MREIKFRAWNKESKQYVPPMTIQEMIYSTKNEFSLEQLNEWFIFEQYTGLKDKNGKEIYEGNIISFDNNISIVFYNSIHCAFMLADGGTRGRGYLRLGQLSSLDIEVIGNIFENPELLEVE